MRVGVPGGTPSIGVSVWGQRSGAVTGRMHGGQGLPQPGHPGEKGSPQACGLENSPERSCRGQSMAPGCQSVAPTLCLLEMGLPPLGIINMSSLLTTTAGEACARAVLLLLEAVGFKALSASKRTAFITGHFFWIRSEKRFVRFRARHGHSHAGKCVHHAHIYEYLNTLPLAPKWMVNTDQLHS